MTTNETNFSSMEYIFLLPDEVLTANTTKLVHLKNPRTEEKALFLLDFDNRKLYEILTFNEKYRSWFVGENIISDGSLKIATICNPLFLILPYLLKASKMKQNIPLDQLLEDKDFPDMVLLIEIVNDISFIADRKGPSEFNVWCYNEASTLSWLQDKTENLSTTLQKKRERTLQGFSLALNNSIDDKDAYLNLAYGLLCEYLCENMSTLLRIHLKLPEIEQKEKENLQQDLPFKKMKLNEVTMEKNCTKTQLSLKSKSALSAKEKGLARSAKGTKSIASFFIKKL